jgi:hypothetical protein
VKPLTKARRGALHVLSGGPARYSNETIVFAGLNGVATRYVHWQAADWLLALEYATRAGDTITITDAGRERLRSEVAGVRA